MKKTIELVNNAVLVEGKEVVFHKETREVSGSGHQYTLETVVISKGNNHGKEMMASTHHEQYDDEAIGYQVNSNYCELDEEYIEFLLRDCTLIQIGDMDISVDNAGFYGIHSTSLGYEFTETFSDIKEAFYATKKLSERATA